MIKHLKWDTKDDRISHWTKTFLWKKEGTNPQSHEKSVLLIHPQKTNKRKLSCINKKEPFSYLWCLVMGSGVVKQKENSSYSPNEGFWVTSHDSCWDSCWVQFRCIFKCFELHKASAVYFLIAKRRKRSLQSKISRPGLYVWNLS